MKKTFIINNTACTFIPGTAVASCDLDAGARQDAILCVSVLDGLRDDLLIFGYEMPSTANEAQELLIDDSALEHDYDSVATFQSPIDYQSWDWSGGILAGM